MFSCAFWQQKDTSPLEFRFALIGNTFAESPFRGKNEHLDALVKRINEENPLFVVHLGDIVHGGKSWMGINTTDLARQYRNFKESMDKLNPLLFTVKGEKDMLDASFDEYMRATKRKPFYSFNYGAIHCIVIDNSENGAPSISQTQADWVKRNLARNRKKDAIIIFSHYPFFTDSQNQMPQSEENIAIKDAEDLHKIFVLFPVKMVISGHCTFYNRTIKDGIEYIVAGCDIPSLRIPKQQRTKNNAHYYIVDYRGGSFTVIPRYLD